ncbi:proline--tRNA ligase [Desulfofundulus thermocisternus]|uniref:proline--tRNA ligase n=1 Tax=Desulfofundulus thermocisternus TaxID=42471 RepID=UPI0019FEE444|nr:proline--tRNA ligase [Desulfofundulus thermocisternus]MBE3585615.1 proline--tRNA ligase [Thermoanaerobacter sp.]MCS5696113.1 proline--tRNA ligase [Desulfofundulus thermocisternus]
MRISQLFLPTLREVPAEAEVISHQLLLRAGFIRKAAAGVYTFLPLAWRVIKKIEQIIREEMDRQGGQEIMMPIIQPAELWQESGRWDVYGPELFRLKDRHGRDFCLGPTHEEIITALVRQEIRSYRQLPQLLYQIQNKYRDERRPRFGLLRGREFIMKDLYSFDRDEAGLEVSYQKMYEAYTRVFTRCGLKFRPVEADSGAIGGNDTHEFMVLADSGEALVVFCPDESCGYAANVERATSPVQRDTVEEETSQPLKLVDTPGMHTVEQVTAYLGLNARRIIKTILYQTEKGVVAALVRGDRDVNEVKLQKVLDVLRLELADAPTVEKITGARVGYAGPVGLQNVRLVADDEVMLLVNAVAGANRDDAHLVNVNPGRDFVPHMVADIRVVRAGDPCPKCGALLRETRGIEVGQIFKLGDKYSRPLGATYLDEQGQSRPMIMGCYGIGVTRTMAAAVEQNHDEDGIIWPVSIAPFHVVVIPVNHKDEHQMNLAEEIYQELQAGGVEVVLDDRAERAGVKFKDADLVGYPMRITVGNQAVQTGELELRYRATREMQLVSREQIAGHIREYIDRAVRVL